MYQSTSLVHSAADDAGYVPAELWQVVNLLGTELSFTRAQRHAAQEFNWKADC